MNEDRFLAEARTDPNNTVQSRLTVKERQDYTRFVGAGMNHKSALIALNRHDLITPDLPRLTDKGAYDPADLLRYFADAHRRGMKADAIARALKVRELDRIHYFMSRDGKRALERAAAKMNV